MYCLFPFMLHVAITCTCMYRCSITYMYYKLVVACTCSLDSVACLCINNNKTLGNNIECMLIIVNVTTS